MTVTIEIDADLARRLDAVAERTGEKREDLLRNALANGIGDVEDYFSAAAMIERIKNGQEKTYPLEEGGPRPWPGPLSSPLRHAGSFQGSIPRLANASSAS